MKMKTSLYKTADGGFCTLKTIRLGISQVGLWLWIALLCAGTWNQAHASHGAAPKKHKKTVYMSYILHGNMNYDRYVRPTIWREFSQLYDNLLTFMDEHPDFKGQLQFSGQTFGSLLQAAPEVVEHARRIHERGQLNFTGTFYSEPVNVNMDGETNYRCAWLGTQILERMTGVTDGFYLQERAYHPQLPWILNHAHVSWTPVIVGEDYYYPFRLRGMDGSLSVCVPISRNNIVEKVLQAPDRALLIIEEDYEIPQSFVNTYQKIQELNQSQQEVEVKWITVQEYIRRFGLSEEHYVDHATKARNRENGTYSRWTADPLDMQVQEKTVWAMQDMRAAEIANSIAIQQVGVTVDVPFEQSDIQLKHDPLVWNIERAELYPDIEPQFLARGGQVTLLSKAEHQLLWAVNSDSKGWFPLYEKRRERMNALENSSLLSKKVIHDLLDAIGSRVSLEGYDQYYIVANFEPQRTSLVTVEEEVPYTLYNYVTGEPLKGSCRYEEGGYRMEALLDMPAYGYTVIGAKRLEQASAQPWQAGNEIQQAGVTLRAEEDHLWLKMGETEMTLAFDDFQLKALAEMNDGKGDELWRAAQAYGTPRISVRTGYRPQLRIEHQLDWLLHVQQIYTIAEGRVIGDVVFDFPHPTVLRREPEPKWNFSPEGLNLTFTIGMQGETWFDIPYGISHYPEAGISYHCPLSTLFYQDKQGGWVISPQSGEQAFKVDADTGQVTLYLGASTTSGPIRDVGLTFKTPTEVDHEPAWYAEPFHGRYHHRFVVWNYDGDWRSNHIPAQFRAVSQPVYLRRCHPGDSQPTWPVQQSFLQVSEPNVEVTTLREEDGSRIMRLNEREGRQTSVTVTWGGKAYSATLQPFGIETIRL